MVVFAALVRAEFAKFFSKDLNFFEQRSFSTVGVFPHFHCRGYFKRLDCIILISIVIVLSGLVMSFLVHVLCFSP